MKIEVGKQYKTRDGRKACIVSQHPRNDMPSDRYVGYLEGDTIWTVWSDLGTRSPMYAAGEDLVFEWVDPPRKIEGWLNIYEDSYSILEYHLHPSKKDADLRAMTAGPVRVACIYVSTEEGKGL